MYYHHWFILRFEKNCICRQSCRLPNSHSRGVVFWLRISPRIWSQIRNGWTRSVRDLCWTGLCKNPRKSASLPCPFKRSIHIKPEVVMYIWMRHSRMVRASDSQCRSRNCPVFDTSILRHSRIWGAADEAVLKNILKKKNIWKNHTLGRAAGSYIPPRPNYSFISNYLPSLVFSQCVLPIRLTFHACLHDCFLLADIRSFMDGDRKRDGIDTIAKFYRHAAFIRNFQACGSLFIWYGSRGFDDQKLKIFTAEKN